MTPVVKKQTAISTITQASNNNHTTDNVNKSKSCQHHAIDNVDHTKK